MDREIWLKTGTGHRRRAVRLEIGNDLFDFAVVERCELDMSPESPPGRPRHLQEEIVYYLTDRGFWIKRYYDEFGPEGLEEIWVIEHPALVVRDFEKACESLPDEFKRKVAADPELFRTVPSFKELIEWRKSIVRKVVGELTPPTADPSPAHPQSSGSINNGAGSHAHLESGEPELALDEINGRVRRKGYPRPVEFGGKIRLLSLLKILEKSKSHYTGNNEILDEWANAADICRPELSTLRSAITELRKMLGKLDFTIINCRSRGYQLAELTDKKSGT